MMKNVLAIALFALAVDVSAACLVQRPGDAPVLPDGAVATGEQMYQAQLAAERYLMQADAYIECQTMNSRQHKVLESQVESFSEQYNEEMIKYQARNFTLAES